MKLVAVLPELYPDAIVKRLEQDFEVCRLWEEDDPEALARASASEAEGFVTTSHHGIPDWAYQAMPKLRIIGCYGVGYDGIDVAEAARRGVWVSNTPDVLNDDVADLAVALALAATRSLVSADAYVRAGSWPEQGDYGLTDRLSGKWVGLVGCGRIGQAIGRRMEAFGCRLAYHSRSRRAEVQWEYFGSLLELAAWAEILCVAVPGGDQTRDLIDADVLAALGPQGWLVNVARGSVVCEQDLVAAVTSKAIAGAGLDVFVDEPRVPPELIEADNVVLSPHQGSATDHTRTQMGFLVADNIKEVLAGRKPITPVNMPENP